MLSNLNNDRLDIFIIIHIYYKLKFNVDLSNKRHIVLKCLKKLKDQPVQEKRSDSTKKDQDTGYLLP